MFQGGENPDARLTTLQESQRSAYPNDVPVKGYDFQAPLGEFGEMHAHLPELKLDHYFLQDFGSQLAPREPSNRTGSQAGRQISLDSSCLCAHERTNAAFCL